MGRSKGESILLRLLPAGGQIAGLFLDKYRCGGMDGSDEQGNREQHQSHAGNIVERLVGNFGNHTLDGGGGELNGLTEHTVGNCTGADRAAEIDEGQDGEAQAPGH